MDTVEPLTRRVRDGGVDWICFDSRLAPLHLRGRRLDRRHRRDPREV